MPDTTAEWIRPEDRAMVRKEARNEFYTASKPFTGMKIAEDLVIMMKTGLEEVLPLQVDTWKKQSLGTVMIFDIG